MDKALRKKIDQAIQDQDYVSLKRHELDYEGAYIEGVPLFRDENLLLVRAVHDDLIMFNGYSIVFLEDITEFDNDLPNVSFILKALELKKQPKRFTEEELKCGNLGDFLKFFEKRKNLVVIYTERIDNTLCDIGKISEIDGENLLLQEITPNAIWEGEIDFAISDITRIDFDGGYEEALRLVAES